MANLVREAIEKLWCGQLWDTVVWMMEAGDDMTVCELSEDVLAIVSVIGYSYLPTAF